MFKMFRCTYRAVLLFRIGSIILYFFLPYRSNFSPLILRINIYIECTQKHSSMLQLLKNTGKFMNNTLELQTRPFKTFVWVEILDLYM